MGGVRAWVRVELKIAWFSVRILRHTVDVHSHIVGIVGFMMPTMPSGTPRGSAVRNVITWVQIMETLAAAAAAPILCDFHRHSWNVKAGK